MYNKKYHLAKGCPDLSIITSYWSRNMHTRSMQNLLTILVTDWYHHSLQKWWAGIETHLLTCLKINSNQYGRILRLVYKVVEYIKNESTVKNLVHSQTCFSTFLCRKSFIMMNSLGGSCLRVPIYLPNDYPSIPIGKVQLQDMLNLWWGVVVERGDLQPLLLPSALYV